jgi:truncated hemoglobin YjbI
MLPFGKQKELFNFFEGKLQKSRRETTGLHWEQLSDQTPRFRRVTPEGTISSMPPRSALLEALGGEEGCRSLSAAFYARVGKDPVLRPFFPGKSLRCAAEEFAAFLIQFLGGDEKQTQHRWWLSLRESHARFQIGPNARHAWLRHMWKTGAALAGWPLLAPGNSWNGSISIHARLPTDTWGWFLTISPGWLGTMKMQLLEGLTSTELTPSPG